MAVEVVVRVEAGERDVAVLSAAELDVRLRSIEQARRVLAVLEAEAISEIDHRRLWAADGHHSVRGLLRLVGDDAPGEIAARVQLAGLTAAHPEIGEDLATGRYGVAAARRLARAWAHPRAGRHFGEFAAVLRDSAAHLVYPDLCRCVERWELLVDPGGADATAREIHQARRARLTSVGQQFVLRAEGDVVAGEAITKIFEAFLRVEFDKDWAWTLEHHGDAACAASMPRSDAQRRFDALEAIFLAAASTPPGAQAPEPVVNVIVDPVTFTQAVARVFGLGTADVEADPVEVIARHRETAGGLVLAPEQVATLLVAGHVRRVVCDPAGVVIDWGRRQRFFTGAARRAASLLHTRCVYAGCRVPVGDCQIDHLREWQHHGPTDQHNAGPACDWHNLFKTNHRYRIERDHRGRYHTYRPDGAEVT